MAEALCGLELILRGVAERHRAAYVAGARCAVAIRGYRAAPSRNAALHQQRAPFLRVRGIPPALKKPDSTANFTAAPLRTAGRLRGLPSRSVHSALGQLARSE